MHQLSENLTKRFQLPLLAVDWLCQLFDAIQVFDDLYDCDKLVSKDEIKNLIWSTFISLPQNPFFKANQEALWPLLATAILKWHGANKAEENLKHDAMSFAWRAGYYDIVLMVVGMVHGHKYAADNAAAVMSLYGETFCEYQKEFNNA